MKMKRIAKFLGLGLVVALAASLGAALIPASAGVQVNLRPLGLLLELRHASSTAVFLGTGFGF